MLDEANGAMVDAAATARTGLAAAYRIASHADVACAWCGTTEGRIRPVCKDRRPTGRHICDPCVDAGRSLTPARHWLDKSNNEGEE